jgi:F-type H+-transporting ATPase subunit delta
LVEKRCFRFVNSFIRRIEQKLDEEKGILALTIESAKTLDGDSEKELVKMIMEKTGASDVKITKRIRPELLGGYLLRIGAFYIDATVKGQLEKMKSEFTIAAAKSASHEGGNNVQV